MLDEFTYLQKRAQTYIFYCFSSQNDGRVASNTYTIFDTNSNTSKMLRPAVRMIHIDAPVQRQEEGKTVMH